MKIVKCQLCGKEFQTDWIHGQRKFCGNIRDEGTCAWKNRKNRAKLRDRKYKDRNREKLREKNRLWKLNHPENKEIERRKRKQSRLKLRFQALQRDNFTCQYCGRKAPGVEIQVDHRFPKSKGGLDKIENYITSCRDCNVGKGDSILEEFNN